MNINKKHINYFPKKKKEKTEIYPHKDKPNKKNEK